ncbi:NUDIX hydrolase [Erythrobacter aureus]|uniref:NUDIX domain-containing protein n=1 Tax=Erythrobacter aureus TaxID=2182384 RepID=A0A345YJ19_9SPHN|nr:NUDIX hydrolase [Erythrobacter aureus]AXK43921.1 NUDIX domain-containing protein [Erythrobacter aureus]
MSIIREITAQTDAYLKHFPEEEERIRPFTDHLKVGPATILDRKTMFGHITASAFIVDPSTRSALLVHHKSLNLWLQPGGHYEGDPSLQDAALREATEETGISRLRLMPIAGETSTPLDIDTHAIPAKPAKGEGDHRHHDFVFLMQASADETIQPQEEEVVEAKWVPLDDIAKFDNVRMKRLALKALEMLG